MEIVNLHITSYQNHDNVGDANCAPLLYFDIPGYSKRFDDVRLWDENQDAPVVLGGGGILIHPFDHIYDAKVPKAKKPIIFWGAGSNTPELEDFPVWMNRLALIGIRDVGTPFPWVPCASCMSPLFDNVPEPTRELVVYDHWQWPIGIDGFDRMRNDCMDFAKVVRFLASGETIYTSSYHGVYWGTLLGRRVILSSYLTRSTRWLRMRHPPSFVSGSRWQEARASARTYPEALAECRAANIDFHKSVTDLLS